MSKKITDHGVFKTRQGIDASVQINTLDTLPKDRYILALTRLAVAIGTGRPLQAFDDTTPGNKSMGCSWGLCDDHSRTWPDAQDHTFPLSFVRDGRISTLASKFPCPMDRRTPAQRDLNGCFYSCRVFQANKKEPAPTRDEALKLYNDMITNAQKGS